MAGEWRTAFDAWIDEKFKVNGRSGTVTETTIIKVLGEGYEAGYLANADHAASLQQQLDAERERRIKAEDEVARLLKIEVAAQRVERVLFEIGITRTFPGLLTILTDLVDALAAPAERRGEEA